VLKAPVPPGKKGFFSGYNLLQATPCFRSRPLHYWGAIVTEAVASPPRSPVTAPIGTVVHGFKLVRDEFIPELNTQAQIYEHVKTGSELVSLLNDDENKVFGACFRTPPSDSTGVPHILEHSVLCGSRKYRTKEPFVELLKGSLQTFLNAFTYPDKTCYPVASCNAQDLRNLVDVYLDAVFHPRLTPQVLQQEGWHYELEKAEDPLIFKGVVFNEMKGVYSSPDSVMGSLSMRLLFPDTTYGVESGGHPRNIPDLTWEQFSSFHRTYYHPSNARLFFYGDFDPIERLRILDDYLSEFDRLDVSSEVALQPRWSEPRYVEEVYDAGQDADADAKKSMVTLNWLLCESTDQKHMLALEVLSYILLGTSASPLRKALIESGLGEDVTGGGLESEMRQTYFSCGLKGIAYQDAKRVEELVLSTLGKLAEDGIDSATIEASVNTIEFQMRENNTGSFPRGLSLMLRSLTTWLYDQDPLTPLRYEEPLAYIKQQVGGGKRFFENLIKEWLIDNQHRLTLVMKPDPLVGQKNDEQEAERLRKVKEQLGPAGVEAVIQETKALKLKQETPDDPQDLAKIPMLTLDDLEPSIRRIPTETDQVDGTTVLHHQLFTNDVVYLDLAMDLSPLPAHLLPYVPLFSRALLQMGTSTGDFVALNQRIGQKTGGIRTTTLTSAGTEGRPSQAYLILRAKAMRTQTGEMLDIIRDVLTDVQLDNQQRFKQILLEQKAAVESRLVPGGHMLASSRLSSLFNPADWAAEQMGGVSFLQFVRKLVVEVDTNWPQVLSQLRAVHDRLVNSKTMLVSVTDDDDGYKALRPQLSTFLSSLPSSPVPSNGITWSPQYGAGFEGFVIPAQVNYVAKGANVYNLGYKLHGSSLVVQNVLSTAYLWNTVRVQGGAYGAFCRFDPRSGMLTLLSYRDPNVVETLKNYDAAAAYLRTADITEHDITKAVIGTFGDLDSYQLPDAKGFTSMVRHIVGDTDEYRQRMRDQIRATSRTHLRHFADVLDAVAAEGKIVVVGSEAAIRTANQDEHLKTPLTTLNLM